MKAFAQCKTSVAVAAAITTAHKAGEKEQGSRTDFFRDSVKDERSTGIMREALRILAERPEQRQSKYPEAGPFYMARTILGDEKRMTAPPTKAHPEGEYNGHFKVSTAKCEKDDNKRLTSAPELIAKTRKVDAPEPEELTELAAKTALLKWAKGKGIAMVGALAEIDSVVLTTALSDLHASMAAESIKAEAKATADKANQGEAEKKAA